MIRSIISDLGKVLIDFDNAIFYRKISPYTPHSLTEIADLVSTRAQIARDFDMGKLTPQEFHARVIRELDADLSFDAFYAIYNDVFSAKPPAAQIMRRLKPRYRMVMLSNTDVMRFAFIRANFPEAFFFDAYVLSYEQGCMKPDPLIYQTALEQAQSLPQESLFIDDRPENIEAAGRLGIQTIHYQEHTDLIEEFRKRDIGPAA